MKQFLGYLRNKIDIEYLKFHYLRVGNAAPLLDLLRENTDEFKIEWVQHEVDSFSRYHFGGTYAEYCGALVNLDLNDDDIATIRKDFWEHFIWKTEEKPIPVAIVIPNSSKYGSLTLAQVQEALSLVRLTDRSFKLFENKDGVEKEIVEWLAGVTAIVHRKNYKPENE